MNSGEVALLPYGMWSPLQIFLMDGHLIPLSWPDPQPSLSALWVQTQKPKHGYLSPGLMKSDQMAWQPYVIWSPLQILSMDGRLIPIV